MIDYLGIQIMIGEMLAMGWLSYEIYKRVHVVAASAFLYFSLMTLFCMYRVYPFYVSQGSLMINFFAETARSFAFLLCAVLPFVFMSKRQVYKFKTALLFFASTDAVVMLLEKLVHGSATGIIGMDSVDATFLAVIYPMFLWSKYKKESFVILAAILIAKGSTGYAVLGIELVSYMFFYYAKGLFEKICFTGFTALSLFGFGKIYLSSELLNDNGRLNILMKSYDLFKGFEPGTITKWLIGLGTGSYYVLIPFAQRGAKLFFIFAHNEPAQVIFEQGLIGLILLLTVWGIGLYKSRQYKPIFLALLGAGFQSLFQPCFRYFIFAVLMSFLCRISYENKPQFI